jgi:hypothetical protein
VTITAKRGAELAHYSADLSVLPADAVANERIWDIAAVALVLILFGLHQWRKQIYKRSIRNLGDAEWEASTATAV